MKNSSLVISEIFSSIQGEGRYAGYPAIFLRLSGCNLLCEGAGWRCDTIEVWQKGKHTIFESVFDQFHLEDLRNGHHLVITGGEPMLHEKQICNFLYWLENAHGILPFVEIETNGTILPQKGTFEFIDHWNVSFKLASSGAGDYKKRINETALDEFLRRSNVGFKIVISSEEDIVELCQDFPAVVESGQLWLMPAGENQEQLAVTRPIVVEACKRLGCFYSDRLHIVIWNKKTGV